MNNNSNAMNNNIDAMNNNSDAMNNNSNTTIASSASYKARRKQQMLRFFGGTLLTLVSFRLLLKQLATPKCMYHCNEPYLHLTTNTRYRYSSNVPAERQEGSRCR